MPQLNDSVVKFLGEGLDPKIASKIKDWTFNDLRALSDAFDALPPNQRKQAKSMCCCSMCCCAAAVTVLDSGQVPTHANSEQ